MLKWYVLKTKNKKEKEVVQRLQGVGFEIFFPTIQGLKSPKPLFPGYLFIQTDFGDTAQYQLVRYTHGIHQILGGGEGPQVVSPEIVEMIRSRTRNGSLIERDLLVRPGDPVRVKKGMLKDLIGIVEKNLPDSRRVQILFKWLSTTIRAKVKYTELERS